MPSTISCISCPWLMTRRRTVSPSRTSMWLGVKRMASSMRSVRVRCTAVALPAMPQGICSLTAGALLLALALLLYLLLLLLPSCGALV